MLAFPYRIFPRSALAASLAALSAGTAFAQTTWHVDVNGTPPGSGTAADPYTSIVHAIAQASTVDGDRILVQPGEYVGDVVFTDKVLTVESAAGPAVTRIVGLAYFGEDLPFSSARLVGFRVDHADVFAGTLERCILLGSNVPGSHAVFFAGNARIIHCTISGYGLAIQEFGFNTDPLTLRNCAIWDVGTFLQSNSGAGHVISHCAGGPFLFWPNVGNVRGNPGFWQLGSGDVHLAPGSPCVDAGDPASPLDPDGTRADIGALPFDASYAPQPAAYCAGKISGQGCVPSMSAIGTCSATSGQPFLVTATQVSSNKFGRLFYGFAPASTPFIGGLKCVGAPTTRTPLSNSGGAVPCTGVLIYDFNARIASGVDPALVPGRFVYAQYWYRDPTDPAGFGVGLSNALSFAIAP